MTTTERCPCVHYEWDGENEDTCACGHVLDEHYVDHSCSVGHDEDGK